jgi:hypothetical protein
MLVIAHKWFTRSCTAGGRRQSNCRLNDVGNHPGRARVMRAVAICMCSSHSWRGRQRKVERASLARRAVAFHANLAA